MAAMMHSVQHSQFITEDETIHGITQNVCQKEDDNRGAEVRVLWCNWSSILTESLFTSARWMSCFFMQKDLKDSEHLRDA